VLFAIVLGIVNTMAISGRERLRSMGILQALGFPSSVPVRLYLLEAMALTTAGGACGVLLAWLSEGPLRKTFGTQIPLYAVAADTYVWAAVICIVTGLVGGAGPARRSARMRAVDQLRRGV